MRDSPAFAIRQMQLEDAPAVAALTTELGYPSTGDEIARRYRFIGGRSDTCLFIAQQAGDVVGWIHVQATHSLENDPRAEIWGLVVSESVRGTGAGRRLVEAAESWAKARGLEVMAVRSNQLRTGARGFYEHLGYAITKTQNAFRKNL
jgi:ribosomal protein S18 acetylase RimI-like enzyme